MIRGLEIRGERRWNTPALLRWVALAALLGLPWFAIDTHATVSIFLDLNKDNIKGEATSPGHEGEIEMLTMNFGASSSSTFLNPGSSQLRDISIVKYTDQSTPELMRRLLTGNPLSTARIEFVETINQKEVPVVTFELKEVLVTSHTTGGTPDPNRLTENLTLNFEQITFETFSYPADGGQTVNPIMTWDASTGTGSLGGTSNAPPTITAIAGQTIDEDNSTIAIPFTIGDPETPSGSLTVSKSTNNPMVVPLSGIALGGTGDSRTVTITPTPNAIGSATITMTVTDALGLTASQPFTVNVTPVNDAPTIQAIPNQVTDQNQALTTGINVGDIDTAATSVTISAVSDNPSLIPAVNISFSGSGAATLMTLTPVTGQTGTALITLTANDGAANSAPVPFTLIVNAVTPTGPTDIQWQVSPLIAENSAADTAVGSLVTTDSNHANSQITYTLLDSADGRFKLGPLGSILVDNGTLLDFETSPSHSITVRATDPDENAYVKVLQIDLSNVNEAPVISVTSPVNFLEGSTNPVTGIALADPDSGSADISVTFGVPSGLLTLDATGPLAGKVVGNSTNSVTVTASATAIQAALNSGGLTYVGTSVPPGSYPLSIQANDLGNTGPGGPQSSSASLEINIVPSQFNQWRQEFFPTQLDDLAISGPLADFDKDGIANLLEYGVGSSPTDPAEGPGMVEFIQEDVAGTLYPAVRFKRLKPDFEPSLQIQLEIATDDFNWRTDPGDTAIVSTVSFDASRDTMVIRSTLPVSSTARQMMHLRFTLAP